MHIFGVNGQSLERKNWPKMVAESVNYLEFGFEFSSDWGDIPKYASFWQDGGTHHPYDIVDGKITADKHVNLSAGKWIMNVTGLLMDGSTVVKRITTNEIEFTLLASSTEDGETMPDWSGEYGAQTLAATQAALAEMQAIQAAISGVYAAQAAAEAARDAAETAKSGALSAQGGAMGAMNTAVAAKNAAEAAQGGAQTAHGAAEQAQEGAEAAQARAEQAEQNAGSVVQTHDNNPNAHADLFALATAKTYGCFFVGSASLGSRFGSADGLIANVGVDATPVVNSFDSIYPWSLMKPANTAIVNGVRVPTHFKGEVGFDALAADVYVYVPIYYKSRRADDGALQISAKPLPEFLPPSKFINADGTYRPYVFLPAYTAGLVGGVPVSRSGYYPHITSLNGWMSLLASCHTAGTLDQDIWISGMQDREILLDLMEIEFATRDHQTIMQGAISMRYATDQTTAGGVNQFTVSTACAAALAVGQAIAIGTTDKGDQVTTNATILTINTTTGVVTFAPTGADVTVATGNYISSRPWKSGACDAVVASSGSPVSNTSGIYPCKYRGVENPYGNTYQWLWDILINEHAPFVLLDPTKYAAGALTADYKALSYVLPSTDGYATEMGFDSAYPFVRLTKSVGGSSTTYFADYYYQTAGLRALCVGGYVTAGRTAGARYFFAYIGPSYSNWTIGASLSPA